MLAALDCVLHSIILTHRHADHTSGVNDILRHCPPETKVYKYPSANKSGDKEDQNLVLEGDRELLPVRGGQFFSVEGATLIASHTPGHTDDHIVLLFRRDEGYKRGKQHADPTFEEGIFTGDSMLGHGTAVFENLDTYWITLHVLLGMLSNRIQAPVQQNKKSGSGHGHDDSQGEPVPGPKIPAYPGHGAVIEDGEARIKQYIQHRQEREAQVLAVLPSRHQKQQQPQQPQPPVQPLSSSPPTKRARLESPSQDNPSSPPSTPAPIPQTTSPILLASVARKTTSSFDPPKRGISPSEIVQAVYPDLQHADLRRAAAGGVLMILQKLRREKRVVRFEYSYERYDWREVPAGTKDEGWGDDEGGRWAVQ